MKPTNINRRDFIKKSGMLLAATSVLSLLLAGEKEPSLSSKNKKIATTRQVVVRVMGWSTAGVSAAGASAG